MSAIHAGPVGIDFSHDEHGAVVTIEFTVKDKNGEEKVLWYQVGVANTENELDPDFRYLDTYIAHSQDDEDFRYYDQQDGDFMIYTRSGYAI